VTPWVGSREGDARFAAPDPAHDPREWTMLDRPSEGVVARLASRGVRLSGRETAERLVELLDAVERFERAVQRAGADLMTDEAVGGASARSALDDPAVVLRVHSTKESADRSTERTDGAGRVARGRLGACA
jgi:hypothetical protein